ncbi:tape measure protein [Paracoccus yeei]|uniref:tape measure protein n=1 Tax=Paracoccus yeei TaxID=147645 RepID=UPI0028D774CF|nr:tape measure protein [Paracoccus yeei]
MTPAREWWTRPPGGMTMMGRGLADVRSAALTGSAVVVGYAGAMAGLAGSFLGPAAEMERFTVQLRNLEGGAEGADRAMKWIMDFATRTPLELNQTVAAYARLKAFGLDPTNGSLQALVDTMAASGQGAEQLDGLVLALGQAWTKGKLQGEEALQMLERGVPVWDLLGKKLGKNAAQLQDMASKGKLGRKELMLLIEAMGERNAGASDNMAKTWDGILSKMSDFWYQFRVMVMNSGVFDYLKTRLNEIFGYFDAMAQDGRLQAIADRVAKHMLAALEGIWQFAVGVRDAWQRLYPVLAQVAEQLGGWDRLGWIAAAVVMRGTLFQLVAGFGRLGLGAGQAALGILSMLSPLGIVRTAALAWMATGIGAALAGVALAGVWIWRNWSGLGVFFRALWTSFREALGPAAPLLDGLMERFAGLRDWVLRITGPIDESCETWQRWGKVAGAALGGVVRAVGDWTAAHPRLAQALGALVAALGMVRLLVTPVGAAFRIVTTVAGALGSVLGIAAQAVIWLGRAFMIAGRLMLANPILAVIAAIAAAAYLIYQNWDGIVAYFSAKIERVRAAFDGGLLNGVLKVLAEFNPFRVMMDAAVGLVEYLTGWDLSGVRTAIETVFSFNPFLLLYQGAERLLQYVTGWSFADAANALITAFTSIDFIAIGIDMMKALWEGMKSIVGQIGAWFKAQATSWIPDMPSWLGGPAANDSAAPAGPPIPPGRALGGPVRAGQIYQWQEEGRELFVPRTDGHVISNRQLRSMQAMAEAPSRLRIVQAAPRSSAGGPAGGRSLRLDIGGITINPAPGMDPQAIARAVRRELENLTRERGFALHDGGDYA